MLQFDTSMQFMWLRIRKLLGVILAWESSVDKLSKNRYRNLNTNNNTKKKRCRKKSGIIFELPSIVI